MLTKLGKTPFKPLKEEHEERMMIDTITKKQLNVLNEYIYIYIYIYIRSINKSWNMFQQLFYMPNMQFHGSCYYNMSNNWRLKTQMW